MENKKYIINTYVKYRGGIKVTDTLKYVKQPSTWLIILKLKKMGSEF